MARERKCLGRQPDIMKITPSSPNIWWGTIVEDRRFTVQQEAKLITLGKNPVTCEAIEVKRNATDREMFWGDTDLPPFYAMMCPVVSRRADGKIKVITPSGDNKLVNADGWSGRPGKSRMVPWFI